MHYILRLSSIPQRRADDPLLTGKRLLEECYSLPLSQIAERCSMNCNTFRKRFTEEFGISPGQYRIRHKIMQAKYRLSSGFSVSETSLQLGCPDVYSFTHQFIAVTGVSPSVYRNENPTDAVPHVPQ